MPKVRIKAEGGPSSEKRAELLNILCTKDIKIVKLLPTYDGYVVITDTDLCINNIYEDDTRNALTAAGFNPILSPEKRAKMTIVLKGIDSEVLKETPKAIETELLKSAPYAKINDVFVMEKTHIIKVWFRTMAMADRVKETGVRLFWFPSHPET